MKRHHARWPAREEPTDSRHNVACLSARPQMVRDRSLQHRARSVLYR
jgi:hypothetical protein